MFQIHPYFFSEAEPLHKQVNSCFKPIQPWHLSERSTKHDIIRAGNWKHATVQDELTGKLLPSSSNKQRQRDLGIWQTKQEAFKSLQPKLYLGKPHKLILAKLKDIYS